LNQQKWWEWGVFSAVKVGGFPKHWVISLSLIPASEASTEGFAAVTGASVDFWRV
jgi:hypothetical protein